MKIVLPVHHFPPHYGGGVEVYTLRLAHWLAAHGHEPQVVCIEAIDANDTESVRAVEDRYDDIRVWRLSLNLAGGDERNNHTYDNPHLGAWFKSFFAQQRPDLAHFQSGYLIGIAPLAAAVEAGIPTVLTLHDHWFLCPRISLQRGDGSLCPEIPNDPAGCAWCIRLQNRRYRIPDHISHGLVGHILQRTALGKERSQIAARRARLASGLYMPDAVVVPARFLAERIRPFVQPERLHIIPLGLDPKPYSAKRKSEPANDTLRIGFVGYVAPHKGVHLLVQAFRRLNATVRPVELHIHGGADAFPSYLQDLHQLADGDSRIHFHGRYNNEQVAEILYGLDVTVVPSICHENYPLAILEAQAAGTPVITAALGGMAELVHDNVDGLHFKPADAQDLSRQLKRVIEQPSLLRHLSDGIQAPRSVDDEMRQLIAVYEHTDHAAHNHS